MAAQNDVVTSPDGNMKARVTGNIKVHITNEHTWQIRIKPGTTKNVPEEAFVAEMAMAMATKDCISELRAAMHHIRHEVFGPSLIYKGMAGSQQPRTRRCSAPYGTNVPIHRTI